MSSDNTSISGNRGSTLLSTENKKAPKSKIQSVDKVKEYLDEKPEILEQKNPKKKLCDIKAAVRSVPEKITTLTNCLFPCRSVARENEEKSGLVTFTEELKVNAFSKKNKEKTDTLLPKNLSVESSTSHEVLEAYYKKFHQNQTKNLEKKYPELAKMGFLQKQDRLEQLDAKDYFSLAEFSKFLEKTEYKSLMTKDGPITHEKVENFLDITNREEKKSTF